MFINKADMFNQWDPTKESCVMKSWLALISNRICWLIYSNKTWYFNETLTRLKDRDWNLKIRSRSGVLIQIDDYIIFKA